MRCIVYFNTVTVFDILKVKNKIFIGFTWITAFIPHVQANTVQQ